MQNLNKIKYFIKYISNTSSSQIDKIPDKNISVNNGDKWKGTRATKC